MEIPKCPWRFGEECLVTEFVTPKQIAVQEAAVPFVNPDDDLSIESVAAWIRDEFTYPLDNKGNPSASGMLKRYQRAWCRWECSRFVYYMWAYPSEILQSRKGICIDTANLCVSVLRALKIPAWVVLGEIRQARDNALIGYHAWAEVKYKGEYCTIETTVEKPVNIIHKVTDTQSRHSDWATERNLYYIPEARYDESGYRSLGPQGGIMMQLIGLPSAMVSSKGFYNTLVTAGMADDTPSSICSGTNTTLAKAWQKEEAVAKGKIREAYNVRTC